MWSWLIRLARWYLKRRGFVVLTDGAYRSINVELRELRGDRVERKHHEAQRRYGRYP